MPTRTDGFEPLLAALSRDAAAYFGDARARLEPVSRRTGPFSDILRLRVVSGLRPSHAFVKVYRPREPRPYEPAVEPAAAVIAEFEATRLLHGAMDARSGVMAPRPIALFPEQCAIVTEEVEGAALDAVLKRARWFAHPGVDLVAIAARIGAWVRMYQRMTGARGALSLTDQRAYIDDRLRYVTPHVLTHEDRARALGLFDDLAARVAVPMQPLVAIHADLCPSNILVTRAGQVTVLDFATASSGTRFHDLSHLFMHLGFLHGRPRFRDTQVPAMQAALLQGFDPDMSADDPLFRLMFLQHVVCHVTWLVDRDSGPLRPAFRWLARLRWRRALAAPLLAGPAGTARLGTALPVHPRKLPLH